MPLKTLEIKDLSKNERDQKVADMEEEIFNLRFQTRTGKVDNPRRIRELRRSIARVKTLCRQDELGKGKPAKAALPGSEG